MGFANDSSVRSLLNETSENRMNQAKATADVLRKLIEEKGMIDVGTGVERELGVSKEKLNQALYMLELEGYPIYGGGVPQVTNPGKQTNIKVICPPGTEHKDIYDFENVHSVKAYGEKSADGTYFEKSEEISRKFACTQFYNLLFMELATDDSKAAEFVNHVIPKVVDIKKHSENPEIAPVVATMN